MIILALDLKYKNYPEAIYLAEHKQLVEDWTTRPYVDIQLIDATLGCPNDYEPLFGRMWNGTNTVCAEGLSFRPLTR